MICTYAGVDCRTLTGVWLFSHSIEIMPHICPSDLLCVLFCSQPLSVNDEQSEKRTKDNNHATVCIPHSGLNSIKSALVLWKCSCIWIKSNMKCTQACVYIVYTFTVPACTSSLWEPRVSVRVTTAVPASLTLIGLLPNTRSAFTAAICVGHAFVDM